MSEIKYKAVFLIINYYFIISESEKIKNKRVNIQLSNVTESIMRNIIIDKQIQQNIVSDQIRDRFTVI